MNPSRAATGATLFSRGFVIVLGEREPVAVEAPGRATVNGWTTAGYGNEQLDLDVPTEGPFEIVGGL